MLSVKKVMAGGAVDYYLHQVRSGLADYYLGGTGQMSSAQKEQLHAPGSAWWGGGASELALAGAVGDAEFVAMYDQAEHPDGSGRRLGQRFRHGKDAAAMVKAVSDATDGDDDAYRRWLARHDLKRKGPRASVAAWDCTFSPVKSVSILWAAGGREVQQQVWAAHEAAVDAGLGYLEQHAAFVRAGRNGVRVLETSGLVVSRFNEWTSRAGDMQIHTHSLVLNRAQTNGDGKWRALDGRALLAAKTGAGAIYNRVLEAELTRRLGVAWRDRPDGLREVDGIDDDLVGLFSTRRRAITDRVERLVDAYEAKYGVPPSPTVQWRMAQDATLTTRASKKTVTAPDALAAWEATAVANARHLAGLADTVTGRNRRRGHDPATIATPAQVLERLAGAPRATFSPHDLLRAALDVVDPADLPPDELLHQAQQLVSGTQTHPELLQISTPDVIDVPPELQRSDGTSMYDRPGRRRWALTDTIDREAWLLQRAAEHAAPTVAGDDVNTAAARHGLGRDQCDAVVAVLGDDCRVQQLVGPAGAGKTRALRAAVDVWHAGGGNVLGLTVSQAAADVLASEADVRTENTAKWLHETAAGRWVMPPGSLVLVDEASMVPTGQLVAIVDQARRSSSKVVLIGDPAQLAAIHPGGGFDLLVDRHGAVRLREVRRFTAAWEANASLQLRRRDPACLAEYAMRDRIHSGPSVEVEDALFAAWEADATGGDDGERRSVLMVVTSNEQAAIMAERARHRLIEAGVVDGAGPTVALRDNDASVGDHIVTRRNRRNLHTSDGRWVVNGDVWSIDRINRDRSVQARRHRDHATVTLPANYLADHAHLGYATTAHRSQGMTVDFCHALTTAGDSHDQLYVAATRGRHANHLWVAVDSIRDQVHPDQDPPAAERILSAILARRDPNRLAAHQVIQDSQHDIASLGRLGAIFDDACRRATTHWAATTLHSLGIDATDDPHWPSLIAKLRQLALAGHDLQRLLPHAATALGDDVGSAAAVLHWRLSNTATAPTRPRGPSAAIPAIDTSDTQVAHQTMELMRHRWRELRQQLSTGDSPHWLGALGPRPHDHETVDSWLTAATAAAAYRERYELAQHHDLIGPRPTASRPAARAAHDHAQAQIDRHSIRNLDRLDDHELDRLAHRHRRVLDARPSFDPNELEEAHRTRDQLDRSWRTAAAPTEAAVLRQLLNSADRDLARLEHFAGEHGRWRRAANNARQTLRQLEVITDQRATRIRPKTSSRAHRTG